MLFSVTRLKQPQTQVSGYDNGPIPRSELKRIPLQISRAVRELSHDSFSPEILTAYHEAGHCVMAASLGGKVIQATLEPERDDSPRRLGDVKIQWRGRPNWKTQSLVVLAGPVAEMVYEQEPVHPKFKPEWISDWDTAWLAAAQRFPQPDRRNEFLVELTRGIYRLLNQDDYWDSIAQIADLLLAHETVYEEELEEILLNLPTTES